MKTFDLEDVVRAGEQLDQDQINPGAGVEPCYYLQGDRTPACIAAQIFNILCPELLDVILVGKKAEEASDWGNTCWTANQVCNKKPDEIQFSEDARKFLQNAQELADGGKTWGEALSGAYAYVV